MRSTALKSPTNARFFIPVLLWCVALPAHSQDAGWTEQDAVLAATAAVRTDALTLAGIEAARAAVDARAARPVPRASLDHEQVLAPEPLRAFETTFGVEQSFDLSPWRDRLRDAVPYAADALRAEQRAVRAEVADAARRAYWAVRYHEERCATLEVRSAQLGRAVEAVRARAASGDVAELELLRMDAELGLANSVLGRERAGLEAARAELRALVGGEALPRLAGSLAPPRTPFDIVATAPELARLDALRQLAETEASAIDSSWLRDWQVSAGYRWLRSDATTGHGLVVGLAIPLAFRDPMQVAHEAARAESLRIGAERDLVAARLQQRADVAHGRLQVHLEALDAMPTGGGGRLAEVAELAYAAGEATLSELLDALAHQTELELARIDLEWAARLETIELARLAGAGGDL